ncbi:28S ribosomal protein S18c, mitochondrial [Bagarius yarrelli]|uniref:28S ribosomal protein S18c, mitochondrial n=1 Tax=Bagarius yarrelli TaxID=175774 RepID=A0A556UG38_BAGYA|nr:28S ribosomal protein S18c, mitochondrial [Bagarius yarrelli]
MENPYKQAQKGCVLCSVSVEYKNIQVSSSDTIQKCGLVAWDVTQTHSCVQLLSQFISPHTGRIYGRHITGLCGRKQREVTKAIKRARSMGNTNQNSSLFIYQTSNLVDRSIGTRVQIPLFSFTRVFFVFLTGFMSVTLKEPQFIKDPNVCDIRHME